MRVFAVCLALTGAGLWPVVPVRAATYTWSQYTPEGLEARAITAESTCPSALIDGVASQMRIRAAPAANYMVTVCALPIPSSAKAISVGGQPLPPAIAAPKHIAVIGDTGCRMKDFYVQACNDPAQWPFSRIAAAVAAQKPDLIIHVGDYHYRETPCPKRNAGCAGSPFGDNWDVWQADFFAPAALVLSMAPWVMVRGNHETCDRGGKGWSRALDPVAFDSFAGCNGPNPPFAVQFSHLALAVIDVALANESQLDQVQAASYRAQYASIAALANGPTWVLQHRPIWSPGGTVAGFLFGGNKTLAAAGQTLPGQVQMILSGHHHIFQVLTYQQDLPIQIVAGHGGDTLNPGGAIDPAGWSINGATVKSGLHQSAKFGFAMLDQQESVWVITNYDETGAPLQHCDLAGRLAACRTE